jgi:hypothetical protein
MTVTNFVCSLHEIHADIVRVCVCVFSRDLETGNPGQDYPLPQFYHTNFGIVGIPQIRPRMHSSTPFHNNQ